MEKNSLKKLKLCCFGAGYVGGLTFAVLSSKVPQNDYYVYDIQLDLINKWKRNEPPIYEIGLNDLLNVYIYNIIYY